MKFTYSDELPEGKVFLTAPLRECGIPFTPAPPSEVATSEAH
jgi:hypothetical protein